MVLFHSCEFGTETKTPSKVRSWVVNTPTSSTLPATPSDSMYSPTSMGRRNNSITPAAMLASVPCRARPMARPAAPITAMMLVVCTPNWARAAMTTKIRMA